MDPRAVITPVGPQRPYVYWFRRLLLLALVVIVIVVLAYACGGGGGSGRPSAATSPSPSATTTPSASPTPTHQATPTCRPAQLAVTATTDRTSYPKGVSPRLSATVRNTGATCRYDAAAATRTWKILSGNDLIWTTSDCPRSATPAPTRLHAGASITYALVWDRHRSVKGCAAPGEATQPGTYRLYVTIHGVTSGAAVFRLSG